MSDILCVYYSRTGNTRNTCEAIAAELGAETLELKDDVKRSGFLGWLRCGMDAVGRSTRPLRPYETDRPLSDYKLVLIGTPIWAGRCSSVTRAFLKEKGTELNNVAYVVTRSGESKFREVYRQMDGYLPQPHLFGVSLRSDSVGCHFWQEQFIRTVREWLGEAGRQTKEKTDAGKAERD